MRVVLRTLARPLHWLRQVRTLKELIVTQQQQILNQQQQILALQRDATVAVHRIEERLGILENTILNQQQRILELQVEGKADLGELHQSCLLAAIHTIEGQRAVETAHNREQTGETRKGPVRSAA